jgi:ketosteroid isomerase-like protein
MHSDPNVELIRSVYAEWAQGDFTSGDRFAEDIEFVTGSLEHRTYRGHRGMWEGWHDFLSAWTDFRVEAQDIVEVAPGIYLVDSTLHGQGKESGVPIAGPGTNVILVRDGKIARFEIHWDRAVAVESARRFAESESVS